MNDRGWMPPPPVVSTSTAELETRLAGYRTAVVALMSIVHRDRRQYMSQEDQLLLADVQRLLDGDPDLKR